jgi:16S rRNA (uracil1498-N3)-methyltransferase
MNSAMAFEAEFEPESSSARLIATLPTPKFRPRISSLIIPLLKGDHNDLIIEKVTEIGAEKIVTFAAERSVVRVDEGGFSKKIARWRNIAKAAAKQSKKYTVPSLLSASSLKEALTLASRADLNLVCSLESAARKLAAFPPPKGQVNLVIGPEGDLTGAENATCLESGYQPLSLGESVLRAETAAIVACGGISIAWGEVESSL